VLRAYVEKVKINMLANNMCLGYVNLSSRCGIGRPWQTDSTVDIDLVLYSSHQLWLITRKSRDRTANMTSQSLIKRDADSAVACVRQVARVVILPCKHCWYTHKEAC